MSNPPALESLFFDALDRPPRQRLAFLDDACAGDSQLRDKVLRMLEAHADAGSFLDHPALVPGVNVAEVSCSAVTEGPGTLVGPYKLMEQIGEGGFGLVFVAEQHLPVRRKVALKVIKPGMDTKDVIARFEAERQALALMDHPSIARVFDAGATDSGRPYFVMELVRGITITNYCDEHEFSGRQRLELFVNLCQAIHHAHQKGIIHRDIKPTNVLVTQHDDRPVIKVIDFGVAKALNQQLGAHTIYTHFAQLIGTPLYMSPEQAEMSGLDVDIRSDIYSLGVVLYELLTGTTPFDRQRLHQAGTDEIRRIIRDEEPPNPSARVSTLHFDVLSTVAKRRKTDPRKMSQTLRGDLDWIVMKCLEKDRDRRYESASSLAADVQRHLDDEPVIARPPTSLYRFEKLVRRNLFAVVAASAVILALVLGLSASTWMFLKERAARERAVAAELEQVRLREEAETNAQKAIAEATRSQHMAESMSNLVLVVSQGNLPEAERLLSEMLTPALENKQPTASWLRFRGDLRARAGKWQEAAADYAKVVEIEPEEHVDYHLLAPLLVQSGDLEAYRKLRSRILKRFGKTDDPVIAERMAKDCLVLPSEAAELEAIVAMIAITDKAPPDHWGIPFFQYVKGLAAYRQGKYESAVELMEKVLEKSGELDFRDAQSWMVLAMAHHQLNHGEDAKTAFAKGSEVIETKLPKLRNLDIGSYWFDWITSHVLQSEARDLIEGSHPPSAN